MAKPKGSPKLGGRQKGTPNRMTAAIKDMIITALADVGGVEYLKAQATDNPTAFLSLVGKVLPLQLTGAGDGPVQFQRIERVIVRPED